MHILFLLVGLKAASNNEVVEHNNILIDLVVCTESLYVHCKGKESRVKKHFLKLFENVNDKELLDRKHSLIYNYVRKLSIQQLKPVLCVFKDCTITICIAYLRLWIDELELFSRNEYITTNIDFEEKLRETLNNLRNCEWLNDNIDDNIHIKLFINSFVSCTMVDECISYLFDLIINSSKDFSDYVACLTSMYNSNNNEYGVTKYETDSQTKKYHLDNDNKSSIFNSKNIMSSTYIPNESKSNIVKQNINSLLADIDYLESVYHVNEISAQINDNDLRKKNIDHGISNSQLNIIDYNNFQSEKRHNYTNTQPKNNDFNDQNVQVIDSTKQTNKNYVHENKIDNDKDANKSPKNETNEETKKTRDTKDLNYVKKDSTGLRLWQRIVIYILIVLAVIIIIKLYWFKGKKFLKIF